MNKRESAILLLGTGDCSFLIFFIIFFFLVIILSSKVSENVTSQLLKKNKIKHYIYTSVTFKFKDGPLLWTAKPSAIQYPGIQIIS